MKTQEIKVVFFEKLHQLDSNDVSHGHIATEKTAGIDQSRIDEIRQVCVSRRSCGTCANCDGPISPKRLAAIPWAKYCIACQEIRERSTSRMRWDDAA